MIEIKGLKKIINTGRNNPVSQAIKKADELSVRSDSVKEILNEQEKHMQIRTYSEKEITNFIESNRRLTLIDVIHFILNPVYRGVYKINHEFYRFKKKMPGPMIGYPLKATKQWFIWYFNYQVLGDYKPEQILHSWKMHNTWVEMLSNPEFILNNLGHKYYTFKIHKDIWARWEKLKQDYEKQLSDIEIPQN